MQVIFVWAVRDKETADAVGNDRFKHKKEDHRSKPSIENPPEVKISDRHVVPMTNFSINDIDNDPIYNEFPVFDGLPDNFQPSSVRQSRSLSMSSNNINPDSVELSTISDAINDIYSSFVFYTRFHYTSIRDESALLNIGIDPVKQPHLRFGRPDVPGLFSEVTKLCKESGVARVGVAVCGPQNLVDEVNDLCRVSQMAFCDTIRFDCHKELFDF